MDNILLGTRMSLGSQISAFCRDVNQFQSIWVIEFDDDQFLEWVEEDGTNVFPIWSTESRVKKNLKHLEEHSNGKPCLITLSEFKSDWLPQLIEAEFKLGPNWAGENLAGTTFYPQELIDRVDNFKSLA
jgi:hypothetical protein